jgi:hypothetical protein
MSKYTFIEFIAAQEGDNFNVIERENLEWAKSFVKGMGESSNSIHEGDCTKQNHTCALCVYELYLKEYREYYFQPEYKELDDYHKSLLFEQYGLSRQFYYDVLASNKENEPEFISTSKFTESKIKVGPKYPDKQHFGREEMDFLKRCIKVYWEHYANRVHPDNEKDWNTSQNILKKND